MNKALFCVAVLSAVVSAQAQVTLGQTDTFSSTVQAWAGAQPTWISTGGPAGSGDGFLQLHSIGGSGPTSKMAGNNSAQWSGNYTAANVTAISVDLKNLGATALNIR